MSQTRILALVGSLRSASVNRQLAEAAAELAPEGAEVVIYEGLAQVPFYNEDIDGDSAPAAAVALREAGNDAAAVLLFTPEYNGTIPAVLKNAIDWLSRPYGAGAISGKPVAVVSASPSGNAAKWALEDTVKAVGIAGGKIVEDSSLSVGGTIGKFGEAHPKEHAETAGQLTEVLTKLLAAEKALVDA
ncbi:NADPH-dependent FMN reductase [Rhodococcus phenolicus]|uniref:NADPH-dependent FMN reductase n=1 Tax=Rhodococcus phenolicus TaxID=263849 RepID=UPI00082B9E54|nr:NADPH-dependent FMN reductase [Rhodococcus phenolicus]